MSRYIGIDYSLQSPAVSIIHSDLTFQNSNHYFLTDTKKYVGKFGNIEGSAHKSYTSSIQRYENIACWVLRSANPQFDDYVFIEDYSMGSTGKVFHIAENCAVLKYLLYLRSVKFITIAPTVIKKFYSGKGNADKNKMYDTFVSKTGFDLMKIVGLTGKLSNPVTDIVDSFAIGVYGYDYIRSQKTKTI